MKILTTLFFAITLVLLTLPNETARAAAPVIPMDSHWESAEYDYAVKNVIHPSWGLAHSQRDYWVALELAKEEHIPMDLDVLFAAAFLHDLGGLARFEKPGVDHAVRSAELAEPLLRNWGFPMEKWPQVKEMILGHTYYGPAPSSPQALAFKSQYHSPRPTGDDPAVSRESPRKAQHKRGKALCREADR